MRHSMAVSLGLLLGLSGLAFLVHPCTLLAKTRYESNVGKGQGDAAGVEAQIQNFIKDLRGKDDNIRAEASSGLAKIGKPAVPALIEALKDKDIRAITTFVLGRLGPAAKDAIPALAAELKDNDKNVRAKAAEALGKIGPETIPALLEALKDKEAIVRVRAVQALGRLGPNAKSASTALVDMLQDGDEGVRSEAEIALKKINQ